MSLFGKVLAVLNLLALLCFAFLALKDNQMRQAWSYAVYRWDLALDGFPVDEEEPDGRNRLRHLNLNPVLCEELAGDADVRTMEGYLDARLKRFNLKAKPEGDAEVRTKGEQVVQILLALAPTADERERLREVAEDLAREAKGNSAENLVLAHLHFSRSPSEFRKVVEAFRTATKGVAVDRDKQLDKLIEVIDKLSPFCLFKPEDMVNLADPIRKDIPVAVTPLDQLLAQELDAPLKKPELRTEELRLIVLRLEILANKELTERLRTLGAGKEKELRELLVDECSDRLRLQIGSLKELPTRDGKRDRDAKKLAIARALLVLVDVLPPDAEKNVKDLTETATYKQTRNVLGVRLLSRALDAQVNETRTFTIAVEDARDQERTNFVLRHDDFVKLLIRRELETRRLEEQLAEANRQAVTQGELRRGQQAEVARLIGELNKQKDLTALGEIDPRTGKLIIDPKSNRPKRPGLDQLAREQQDVFKLRLLLRDANRVNQEMEREIRELETRQAEKGGN